MAAPTLTFFVSPLAENMWYNLWLRISKAIKSCLLSYRPMYMSRPSGWMVANSKDISMCQRCVKPSEDTVNYTVKVAPIRFLKKVEKWKFQPQKACIDILQKNETKVMHRITFRGWDTIDKVFHLLLWQQWRFKMATNLHWFHPIYFANEFGEPRFFLH